MKYIIEIKPEPISEVETIDIFGTKPYSDIDCEFVIIKNALTYEPIINLKIESDYSSTFKQCEIVNEIAIIGLGNKFSIFDLNKRESILNLSLDGYFGSFKTDNNDIFIATDSELINVNLNGKTKWVSENLAIDGILINSISESEILGSAEWDPPGGWKPFKVDRNTGLKK